MKFFLSYRFESTPGEKLFVLAVDYWLRAQRYKTFRSHPAHRIENWADVLANELRTSEWLIAFITKEPVDGVQSQEILAKPADAVICVEVADNLIAPVVSSPPSSVRVQFCAHRRDPHVAARLIVQAAGVPWHCDEGLPLRTDKVRFGYEKAIIEVYKDGLNVDPGEAVHIERNIKVPALKNERTSTKLCRRGDD